MSLNNLLTYDIISYREFIDFPRLFVAAKDGKFYLLDCPFDSKSDEHAEYFHVYLLKGVVDPMRLGQPGDWSWIEKDKEMGSLPVTQIEFDATRRKTAIFSVTEISRK